MKSVWVKRLNSLRPADWRGEEFMRKIKEGQMITIEARRGRNLHFHNKFFAMLKIIFDNQDHYKSMDDLLDVCKLRTGHCKTVQTRHGDVKIPKSISFAAMSADEFEDFYNRAVQWVSTEVIPGLSRSDLDNEVADQLMEFAE